MTLSELLEAALALDVVRPLLVAYPRIWGFLMAFPLLGRGTTPVLLINGLALAIAAFASPIVAGTMPDPFPPPVVWLAIAPKEALIGFAIGWTLGLTIWALEAAGNLVDIETGIAFASNMDPASGEAEGPFGRIGRQFAIAVAVTAGLYAQFVLIVVHSFDAWPWHAWWPPSLGEAPDRLLERLAFFWRALLGLAAPVTVALLLVEIGLGLVNRTAQQLDVYQAGMPLKVLVAAVAVVLVAQVWSATLVQLMSQDAGRWMEVLKAFGASRDEAVP